jgi:hypothetical protein
LELRRVAVDGAVETGEVKEKQVRGAGHRGDWEKLGRKVDLFELWVSREQRALGCSDGGVKRVEDGQLGRLRDLQG